MHAAYWETNLFLLFLFIYLFSIYFFVSYPNGVNTTPFLYIIQMAFDTYQFGPLTLTNFQI